MDQQRERKTFDRRNYENALPSVLLALICLLGLRGAAKAGIRGQIRVTLPFEFVVDGETLPAGTYTLSTFSDDKFDGLILSDRDHRVSVFVHPIEIEGA